MAIKYFKLNKLTIVFYSFVISVIKTCKYNFLNTFSDNVYSQIKSYVIYFMLNVLACLSLINVVECLKHA